MKTGNNWLVALGSELPGRWLGAGPRSRLWIKRGAVLSIAVLTAAAIAITWFGRRVGPDLDSAEGRARLRLVAEGQALGSKGAPVVVIEYAALDCHACATFDTDVFPMLLAKYVTTGRVRFVMRTVAIDSISQRGAAMALCVRRQYYFAFIDLLLRTQKNWDTADVADAGLAQAAYTGGLTSQRAKACSSDALTLAALDKISDDVGARYRSGALPLLLINGKRLGGGAGWQNLQRAIDAASHLSARKRTI